MSSTMRRTIHVQQASAKALIERRTELDAICARVLIVSNGCPTRTWAAPPALPAMSSLTVWRDLDGMRNEENGVSESLFPASHVQDWNNTRESQKANAPVLD